MSIVYEYNLDVTSEHSIPPDVLVEHLAVALRSLNFTGKIGITMNNVTARDNGQATLTWDHPFDGPEVFDDVPLPAGHYPPFARGGYTGTTGGGKYVPAGVVHKGEYRFPKDTPNEEIAEYLKAHVLDPYPLTTEAAMQLKEARDERDG